MSNSLLSRIEAAGEPAIVRGTDGQFESMTLAPFTILPGAPVDELRMALAGITRACEPAREADIAPIIATLRARTKSRAEGEGEARFSAATMMADLCRYPLDVVHYACEYWIDGGRGTRFFPSWPELKEICDRRVDGRLRLRRALEWACGEAA